MRNIFGNTPAALILYDNLKDDTYMLAKVASHIGDYNHYVKIVSQISDRAVMMRALNAEQNCDLKVPTEIKTLILNVKAAKRRQVIADHK